MLDVDAFQDFRVGLARLRDGDAIAAIELLRQAAKRDPENPYYISYFGLGLGHAEGMWGEAERLCLRAVCRVSRRNGPPAAALRKLATGLAGNRPLPRGRGISGVGRSRGLCLPIGHRAGSARARARPLDHVGHA